MDKDVKLKRILQIITVLLVLVLGGLILWNYLDSRKTEEQYVALSQETAPLFAKKSDLERQIEALEKEYQVRINGKGTLTLLFTELTGQIYEEMYPKMLEHNFVGVLAVSDTAFPGEDGCMTAQQLEELLQKGWSICLQWDGVDELEPWLKDMQERLKQANLEVPKLIYFETDTYQMEYDELLVEYGMEAVIHHQEEGLPTLTTRTEEGIWHIGAWGWNQMNARKNVEQAMVDGAGLVFSIGDEYYYDEEQFQKMLGVLTEHEAEESLFVTDVKAAYAYRSENEEESVGVQAELEAEVAKLQAEIDKVNSQLRELHAAY